MRLGERFLQLYNEMDADGCGQMAGFCRLMHVVAKGFNGVCKCF